MLTDFSGRVCRWWETNVTSSAAEFCEWCDISDDTFFFSDLTICWLIIKQIFLPIHKVIWVMLFSFLYSSNILLWISADFTHYAQRKISLQYVVQQWHNPTTFFFFIWLSSRLRAEHCVCLTTHQSLQTCIASSSIVVVTAQFSKCLYVFDPP